MTGRLKKFFAVLLVFVLMISFTPSTLFEAAAISDEMQAALDKKKALADELKKIKEEIAAIQDSVEKYEAARNSHADRLENVKEQIVVTEIVIEELRVNLAAAQSQLDQKERDLKKAYDQFGQRLRTMYMNSNSTNLSILLGADSFADFLAAAEYTQRINEYDAKMIEDITALRDEVIALRNDVNESLTKQEDALAEKELLLQEVAGLLQQANSDLSAAQAYEAATEEEANRLIADIEAAQNEIESLMNVYSDVPYVGGDFRWPVPGFDWISSRYGMRTLYGRENFHTGIDIAGAGVFGAGVIASNEGTVSTTVYGYSGYGHYVIIDHGGGYMTLYGHLSSIYVSVGQEVMQGDVIGAVGSTGNSTGPHLHFEIRINGEKINPELMLLRY